MKFDLKSLIMGLLLGIIIIVIINCEFFNRSVQAKTITQGGRFKIISSEFAVNPKTNQRIAELFIIEDTTSKVKYLCVASIVGLGITKLGR